MVMYVRLRHGQATRRYEGMYDWIAIGDDDTVFMYNRLKAFLAHIDHTKVGAQCLVATVSRVRDWHDSSYAKYKHGR